jgi:ribonuclease VapC
MMVVDTSAIVCVFLQEPDAGRFERCIGEHMDALVPAATVLETSIVVRSRKQIDPAEAERWLDDFLSLGSIRIMPVTVEQLDAARRAHRRFGKGTGHPAGLNFGDCFAYALARTLDVPLLFKGSDFAMTDVQPAFV